MIKLFLPYLIEVGSQEQRRQGYKNRNILADCVVAILGAVLMDSDFDTAFRIVEHLWKKRVESSKIGCQYCGFLCGYKELEEHEVMCGARTTKCSQCGKTLLIKNVKEHLEKLHKIKMDDYQQMNSGDICGIKTNSDSSTKFGYLNNLGLNRMTSDEEIAYALALSQQEEQERKKKQQHNNNYNNKNSNFMQKNSSQNFYKKKSSKIDYDELDYEYEKQMFEDEVNNYMEEDEKEKK